MPDSSSGSPVDFGANDWLIDEMYEQYTADPDSVDATWRELFAKRDTEKAVEQKPAAKKPAHQPTTHQGSDREATAKTASAKTANAKTATKDEQDRQQAAAATAKVPDAGSPKATAASDKGDAPKATVEQPNQVKESRPSKPGNVGGLPADPPNPSVRPEAGKAEPTNQVLRGAAGRTAKNMDLSLTIPVATSVRSLPVKLLMDQRVVINNHLKRARGGKVSYTHLIGYAMVKALAKVPGMNNGYAEIDGKPNMVVPANVNLGIAIDLPKPDGTRTLMVPNIKSCESLDFAQFWAAYEDVVRRARDGKLGVDDFAGTTISLTNPGTLGTNHSIPRLMNGQGCIVGVGSMDYPPEFQGSDPERLSEMTVSKMMTLTSTYDHRVIQGAASGEYLGVLHKLLLGEDGFYDEIFRALRIPYEPIRWATDTSDRHEDEVGKQARVMELINAYRVFGHLMADTDPLEYRQRNHHDLDVQTHGLTLWDLDRTFATGSFAKGQRLTLRKILGILRDSYCRTTGIEYMH
ncbi:MAG: 2-oxo acid dehydrogenase subunit E2, partial [Propionibacteriales bacterium]|nr:2-oxo acid dehydrogenase subunit E2 [Propionibacteriales bacterium]